MWIRFFLSYNLNFSKTFEIIASFQLPTERVFSIPQEIQKEFKKLDLVIENLLVAEISSINHSRQLFYGCIP